MPTRFISCSLTWAVCLCLTGCGGFTFLDDTDRMLLDPVQAQELGFTVTWSTDISVPRDRVIVHVAQVGDKIITVEGRTNLVTAISIRDGSTLWQRQVANPGDELFEPFGGNEVVLINSEWRLYHLSPDTGEIQSVSNLSQAVGSAPVLVDNMAIYGGSAGRIFAHDVNAGRAIWSHDMSAGIVARPAARGASVFVGDVRGSYVMIAVDGGELQWYGRTFERISARPIITNLGVFVPSEDATFYALQRTSGRDRWKYRSTQSLTKSPIAERTSVYLPVPNVGLVALSAISGDKLWEIDSQATPVGTVDRGLLLNDRTRLTIVDPQTGVQLHQAPTLWLQRVILGPDNSLLLISPYGKIQRLDPKL